MSDHDHLLRAIIEEPDCDAHRLVFADWLEDDGQGRRAAFVRALMEDGKEFRFGQIGIAEPAEVARLTAHREAVAPGVPSSWLTSPAGHWPSVVFKRGFVWKVACSMRLWKVFGTEVARLHPVEHVTLVAPDYKPSEFAAPFFIWSRSNDPQKDIGGHILPLDVWDATYPDAREEHWYCRHESEQEACDTLSAGLVRWARRRETLPPPHDADPPPV